MLVYLLCFFFSSRRRHTRCALVTGGSDVCSSDLARSAHRRGRQRRADAKLGRGGDPMGSDVRTLRHGSCGHLLLDGKSPPCCGGVKRMTGSAEPPAVHRAPKGTRRKSARLGGVRPWWAVAIWLGSIAAPAASFAAALEPAARPNILVIVADDLGYADRKST